MESTKNVHQLRITAIRLNVTSLEHAAVFYEAGLGFSVEKRAETVITMSLGGERLELVQAPSTAAPYPVERAANDPWFQHFAIRVSDMPSAYAQLTRQQQTPISIGGPQQLPPSTGSVIAYKFRDPDGHPLELSYVPNKGASSEGSLPFLTIDHSAIAVRDLERSLAYWEGVMGFRETGRLLNQGPSQWRLDGLDEALVDIVVLEPTDGGPHLELLHYRAPPETQAARLFNRDDVASTRLRIHAPSAFASLNATASVPPRGSRSDGLVLKDPDGHFVELTT